MGSGEELVGTSHKNKREIQMEIKQNPEGKNNGVYS
jgi:hypothetical protein